MSAMFREVLSVRRSGQSCVLATIIHTQGSVPSFQSSRMLVREDGTLSGTVGGGCVEADVWAAARKLHRGVGPRRLRFDLNADPRQDAGLTCGGTLEIFLDLVTPGSDVEALEQAVTCMDDQKACVLATVVDAGPTGEEVLGKKLLVREDGTRFGSLGRPDLNEAIGDHTMASFSSEKPCKISLTASGIPFEIAIEPILVVPECVLLGAGHVGQQVAHAVAPAGFRVVVADDRAEYANRERFPTADRIHTADWPELFSILRPGPHSYLVIVTRGHKEDMTVLRWALATPARYIGLIGSKRKVLSIFSALEEEGVSRDDLDKVRAPIGLEIGALTPEEIAVSIVAELIAVRRGAPGTRRDQGPQLVRKKLRTR